MRPILLLLLLFYGIQSEASCSDASDPLIVLLKLDDVGGDPNPNNSYGVSKNWKRVTEYIEKNQINASYGVIGDTLDFANIFYIKWLKDRVRAGYIEFWNHGYHSDHSKVSLVQGTQEFKGTSFEQQYQSIKNTQSLGKSLIGISFAGFGPHSSGVDHNTFSVIDFFEEIKYVWFYKPIDNKKHKQFIIEREVELENPIFRPNYQSFKSQFSSKVRRNKYLALQGHPNMWSEKDFEEFILIIDLLKSDKAIFCKPSQTFNFQSKALPDE